MAAPTKQPKSRIEQLPEATRKKILVVSVTGLSLLIIVGWLVTFPGSIKLKSNPDNDHTFSELIDQTKQTVDQVQQDIDKIKVLNTQLQQVLTTTSTAAVTSTTTAGTTPTLTAEELEQIKQKLLNQKSQ